MYLVTIINNGVETAINEVSTKTDNRIIITNEKEDIHTSMCAMYVGCLHTKQQ